MTIVVWDGTTLASDTMAVEGDYLKESYSRKLRRGIDFIIGFCGSVRKVEQWWAKNHENDFDEIISTEHDFDEEGDDIGCVIISREGECYKYVEGYFVPHEAQFTAIGSGSAFALGALSMGATSFQAVDVAIKHDPWCGGSIMCLDFNDWNPNITTPSQYVIKKETEK